MSIWRRLFGVLGGHKTAPPQRVRLTKDSLPNWPKFEELRNKGNVRFDSQGRLRYMHGAPVGDLVLVKFRKDGTPVYKESAEEWFDPDSPKAALFEWP